MVVVSTHTCKATTPHPNIVQEFFSNNCLVHGVQRMNTLLLFHLFYSPVSSPATLSMPLYEQNGCLNKVKSHDRHFFLLATRNDFHMVNA